METRDGAGSLLCELARPRFEDAGPLEDAAAPLEDAGPLEDGLFGFSLTTSWAVFYIGLGISSDAARFGISVIANSFGVFAFFGSALLERLSTADAARFGISVNTIGVAGSAFFGAALLERLRCTDAARFGISVNTIGVVAFAFFGAALLERPRCTDAARFGISAIAGTDAVIFSIASLGDSCFGTSVIASGFAAFAFLAASSLEWLLDDTLRRNFRALTIDSSGVLTLSPVCRTGITPAGGGGGAPLLLADISISGVLPLILLRLRSLDLPRPSSASLET